MDNNMKKKITIIILMIVVLVGGLIFWNNRPIDTKKEIRNNTSHKEEDINFIMNSAVLEHQSMNHKVFHVYYDDSISQDIENEYTKTGEFEEAIVVFLDFKTKLFNNEATGFGANQRYTDYAYIVGKTSKGRWVFVDGGHL